MSIGPRLKHPDRDSWIESEKTRVKILMVRPNSTQEIPLTKFLLYLVHGCIPRGFPGATVVKNPPVNAGDTRDVGLIPGSGRSPGVGNDNPLQCFCLENFMDRIAQWATVHGIAKSRS